MVSLALSAVNREVRRAALPSGVSWLDDFSWEVKNTGGEAWLWGGVVVFDLYSMLGLRLAERVSRGDSSVSMGLVGS